MKEKYFSVKKKVLQLFLDVEQKTLAGLSKLLSTCPKEQFQIIFLNCTF